MEGVVAVLGCGPAGLMAAQAVALAGRPLAIFSVKAEPSKLGGAQFLHKAIPGINDHRKPDAVLTYRLLGDPETYRRKVYGSQPNVPFVSFTGVKDGEEQPAWNLIETYERLWEKFSGHINEVAITAEWMRDNSFDEVFSSVPLPSICMTQAGMVSGYHGFHSQDILIAPLDYLPSVPDNTIVYDGTPDRTWYRSSRIFGVPGTEWSTYVKAPPLPGLLRDRKPISTTCDCHPEVTRVGRRGTWTKGVLTHDAFIAAAVKLGLIKEATDAAL